MSLKTTILALLGQARLYGALKEPLLAETCMAEIERLLPYVSRATDFLTLYLAFQSTERYLLPTA